MSRKQYKLMNSQSEEKVVRPASYSMSRTVRGGGPNPLASVRVHRSLRLRVRVPLALISGRPRYLAETTVDNSPTFPHADSALSPVFNLLDQEYLEFVEREQLVSFQSRVHSLVHWRVGGTDGQQLASAKGIV